MFKFIHAADIHLDSPLRGLERYEGAPAGEIRLATRSALDHLVALAVDERVAFVLIAGDLYDGEWTCHNTGLHFVSRMSRLREAGIKVILIRGNHDAANVNTKALRLPENVRLLSSDAPETVDVDGVEVAIHGQSYATRAVTRDLSGAYPVGRRGAFNIGLLHTCAEDHNEHERYAPCTIADLRSKEYDYWALGHVHGRRDLNRPGEPPIAFAGNVQGRHIREAGAKGCLLVTVDDSGRATPEFRALDVFRWNLCRVEADGAVDAEDLLGRVADRVAGLVEAGEGRPVAARVEVAGACRAHDRVGRDPEGWAQQVRAAAIDASGGRVWVEKVKIRTKPPRDAVPAADLDGPIGELLGYLGELRDDPARFEQLVAETLGELRTRLPFDMREIVEKPEWHREVLDQLGPMLVGKLGLAGDPA